jgi:hypothetical protein
MFGCKRGEVTGSCRKLHNEKLCNLDSSKNIMRVMKSKRMRWMVHTDNDTAIKTSKIK